MFDGDLACVNGSNCIPGFPIAWGQEISEFDLYTFIYVMLSSDSRKKDWALFTVEGDLSRRLNWHSNAKVRSGNYVILHSDGECPDCQDHTRRSRF